VSAAIVVVTIGLALRGVILAARTAAKVAENAEANLTQSAQRSEEVGLVSRSTRRRRRHTGAPKPMMLRVSYLPFAP
jgi:hypothetical protein